MHPTHNIIVWIPKQVDNLLDSCSVVLGVDEGVISPQGCGTAGRFKGAQVFYRGTEITVVAKTGAVRLG